MNPREKALAMGIGAVVLCLAGGFSGRALLIKPLRDVDKRTATLRDKLEKIKAERRAYFANEDFVKGQAPRAFADQLDQASAKSGEMLTQQILLSGLREADFTRIPVGPRKMRGVGEIGWSVQGEGKLANLIDLVFLLQESLCLHRIENLTVSSGDRPGQSKIRFRFLTLVMDPAPVFDPIDLTTKVTLASPQRRAYDSILTRDLLRPYVKREPSGTNSESPPSSTPPPPGPESFRVVSLSEWKGQPEVHVRDLVNQKTQRYKPGDALADGTVVMVDYRPFPMPGNEALRSFSRVILKIGSDYWAIEHGRTLADKYKLETEKLPEQLAKLATPH